LRSDKPFTKDDEIRIIDSINRGDQGAFTELVDHYAKRLYFYALQYLGDRHSAEDIVQDLFMEIWKKRKSWHPNETLQGYLLQSIKNRCTRYAQKQRPLSGTSMQHASKQEFEDMISSAIDVQSVARIENTILQQEIMDAMQTLPERCGLIFRMHRFEGISQKDIARELNISVKTVGNQIQRAVNILHEKLHHHFE
jgi:RNA polymerase sigma-70 factor, ECF subfamily